VRVPNGKGKPSDTWAELEPMPNGTINALLVEKPTAPAAAPRPTPAAFAPATVLTEEERELAELEASMAAM